MYIYVQLYAVLQACVTAIHHQVIWGTGLLCTVAFWANSDSQPGLMTPVMWV